MNSRVSRSPFASHNIPLNDFSENKNKDCENENMENNKSFAKKSWNHFQEFSDSTTIHGVKYLGEKNRPFFERVMWLIVLGVLGYFLGSFIQDIYNKWEKTPTIINHNSRPTPISDIPYPSITVCPYTKIATDEFKKIENDKNSRNGLYYHLCDVETPKEDGRFEDENGTVVIEHIRNVTTSITDLFGSCNWNQDPNLSCLQLFKPIITDDGICYTFNYVMETVRNSEQNQNLSAIYKDYATENWKFQKGYENNDNYLGSYPRRPWLYGKQNQFEIVLHSNLSDELQNEGCKPLYMGFKIFVNSPGIYPHTDILNSDVIVINHQTEVDIEIEPSEIRTSDDLKSYSIKNRQCYFDDERELKFFGIYNQFNCKLECLTNITYDRCGCVKFSMVHSSDQEICGRNEVACYRGVKADELNFTAHSETMKTHCDCLPVCNSINYETRVIHRQANLNSMSNQVSKNKGGPAETRDSDDDARHTVVRFYFKSREFTGNTRNELYGVSDFVSNIGGLLGLFMGTSIVSLIDICYFGSVRIYSNYYHNS